MVGVGAGVGASVGVGVTVVEGVKVLAIVDATAGEGVGTLAGRDVAVGSWVEDVIGKGVAVRRGVAVGLDVGTARSIGLSFLPNVYLTSCWKSAISCWTPSGSNETMAIPTTAPMMNKAKRTRYFTIALPITSRISRSPVAGDQLPGQQQHRVEGEISRALQPRLRSEQSSQP